MAGVAPFEKVEADFWHSDEKYGMLPPLTQDMIAAAEHQLGVTLPADLLRLLRIQNGGVVADAWDACPAEANYNADQHVPFDHLFGIGPAGTGDAMTLLNTPYLVQEWALPSPIVLLSGQGHSWVALDYRRCGRTGNHQSPGSTTRWHTSSTSHPTSMPTLSN